MTPEEYNYEMTPTANVAFKGVVADEISRLYRDIKDLREQKNKLIAICESMGIDVDKYKDGSEIA